MRKFQFFLFISLLVQISCSQPRKINTRPKTIDDIQTSSLANEGIDTTTINKLVAEIEKGIYPNIHSLLIARNNKLVYEKYWGGKDESWGRDLGLVQSGHDSLHDIRSISKSIVSACIGIALQQGKIKSVDQKVFDFFPDHAKLDTGIKSSLTLKHLLTMTSGLVWNEDIPYNNPENSEIQMIRSRDAVEFVLSRPMEHAPGKVWKYNGGTTQLLASIIEKTTGQKVDAFANQYLFQPLAIKNFQWAKYPGTVLPAAASGLRLSSRNLLKFGLLYFNEGQWNSQQIIPAKWVAESFEPHVNRGIGVNRGAGKYGYQFWMWSDTIMNKPLQMVAAIGNGDQRIYFDKQNRLLVVITAGNYNKWDIKNNSYAMLKDYIYPALFKRENAN
ncbi:MAG: serine hydrolase domain-containing protein [Chitinophagaceae bacterium]